MGVSSMRILVWLEDRRWKERQEGEVEANLWQASKVNLDWGVGITFSQWLRVTCPLFRIANCSSIDPWFP